MCWKIGESFVKVSGKSDAFYGQNYRKMKAAEQSRNAAGKYAEAARRYLERVNIKEPKTRALYESGKLSDGHIHARAQRRTVKLFLSHLHAVWYWQVHGRHAPLPYAITHLSHDGYIEVPNPPWPTGKGPVG